MENFSNRPPALPRQGWRAFRSEEEMRILIKEYFDLCTEKGDPALMTGIALYLGVAKETLNDYANGKYDSDINQFKELLREAKTYVEHDKVLGGMKGIWNSQIVKFDLGHNHGWAEKKDVTVEQKGTVKHEDVTPEKKPATPEEAHRAWQDACKAALETA